MRCNSFVARKSHFNFTEYQRLAEFKNARDELDIRGVRGAECLPSDDRLLRNGRRRNGAWPPRRWC